MMTWADSGPPREISSRRRPAPSPPPEKLRAAADYVAVAFARLPVIERVVLIGSVARPLSGGPALCQVPPPGWPLARVHVDLAVWVSNVSDLKTLQITRNHALNLILDETKFGVTHHQIDTFLLDPATDRYLNRLCHFGNCPKTNWNTNCGCGSTLFLQQHEFVFDPGRKPNEKHATLQPNPRSNRRPSTFRRTTHPFLRGSMARRWAAPALPASGRGRQGDPRPSRQSAFGESW
jgi:hypothetical protein